ncbi:filamentous hemagglutinin N-terminal domain-containing protein [Siculibacillus lacustris]|uniref:Filamentous hemagglutinin N-terminal domain-containing protein n=1 Tax=Siculibacillus lacustris TaxID=1549641 RepID=A0A4Q9VRN9_9HYPH|nr:MBG domain-containing protein [Siculibacillus lacustris]TBW38284.1 filamentous hemagglutinin N-terminal domain-containing protein [Siculibacillus lacustris]
MFKRYRDQYLFAAAGSLRRARFGRSHRLAALLATTALAVPPALAGDGLPTGGQVVAGTASISSSGNALTVRQGSDRAIVNWNGFSIGQGNTVDFIQPGASSAILNRVTGSTTSTIAGSLTANGQVYLINPNGIAITSTGTVKVGGGFVASTLDIANTDFLKGKYDFAGDGASAGVGNAGVITVGRGGYAALIGGTVRNDGLIAVPLGKIGLGSGEQATLDLSGDGFLQVAVPTKAGAEGKGALIEVGGKISAEGGTAVMRAATARDAARHAINLSGVVEANAVSGHDGAIVIGGGDGGKVTLSGKVSATSTSGKGGKITVTGKSVALKGATVDASGTRGGGTVEIGGDQQGSGTTQRADTVSVDASSVIRADATQAGNGGRVVVWSDQLTSFDGLITARGAGTGKGGDAEVSGKAVLAYTGFTDLSGPGGFGTLLLDPYNVTISTGSASNSSGTTATGNDSVINVGTLTAALSGANVTVTTGASGSAGSQAGNITVAAPVIWSSGSTLTLSAHGNITLNANLTGGTGSSIVLRSDNSGTGTGTVTFGAGATLSAGDGVSIFYNPSSFAAPTDYSSRIASGTLTAHMLVNTVQDLQDMNTNLNGTYALGRDIDASATASWNGGAGFQPVGSTSSFFYGTLDGQNHTISGLFINRGGQVGVGLFSDIGPGAKVSDLGLIGGSVTGDVAVGSLSGANHGIITNVHTSTTVSGNDQVGGLIGANTATITGAYATGTVSGATNVGGLVGLNGHGSGNWTISDAYATGSVGGSSIVGGLVGSNQGVLVNVYATGSVRGSSYVGGLIGDNQLADSVTASFYNGQTSGQANGVGNGSASGVTGLTTAQMRDGSTASGGFYALASAAGWDFTTVWARPNAVASQSSDGQLHYAELYATSGVVGVGASGSRTYGDAGANVALTYYGSGYTVTTAPTDASGVTASSNVGTYSTSLSGGSGTSSSGQSVRFVYYPGSITVTPATLTVTAGTGTMVYGDSPALTYGVAGWKNGQTNSLLNGVTVAGVSSTSDVGTYATSASGGTLLGAAAGNYTLTYLGGSVTVTPAALTVTAGTGSMVYGDAAPSPGYSVSGWKNGQTDRLLTGVDVTSIAASTSNVGTYTTTATGGVLSGAAAGNYSVNYVNGTVTVTPATLTVTADNGTMFQGMRLPTLGYGVSGWRNGQTDDLLTGVTVTTDATPTSPPGTYRTMAAGGLLAGAAAGNYALAHVGGTLTVDRPLTAPGDSGRFAAGIGLPAMQTPQTIVYADLTGALPDGLVLARSGPCNSPSAGAGSGGSCVSP